MLGLFIQNHRQTPLVVRGVLLKRDSPRRITSSISALVEMDRLFAFVPNTDALLCTDGITKV